MVRTQVPAIARAAVLAFALAGVGGAAGPAAAAASPPATRRLGPPPAAEPMRDAAAASDGRAPPAAAAPLGGEPAFEAIGARQGLTSSTLFAVTVDRHGFVWFAGDSGLHRYDGLAVRTLDRDPSRPDTLASRTNTALAETASALWILGFSGRLQRLDAARGEIAHFDLVREDGARPGRGTNLAVDGAGALWVGTDIGLFRFDPATRRGASFALGDPAYPRITALGTSRDGGTLYVGAVDGRLLALDTTGSRTPRMLVPAGAATGGPVPLALAGEGETLWVGTNQGLFRADPEQGRLRREGVPESLRRWRLDALALARDGTVWLGGAHHLGLTQFDPARGTAVDFRHHADDPHGLGDERIAALAIDARDNLWIGLQRGGANRLRLAQQGVRRFRGPERETSSICAVRPRRTGPLLVSLCGASVATLDPVTGRIERRHAELDAALPFPAPTLTAHALVDDGQGGVLIPTGNIGLLHWWPERRESRRYALQRADGTALPDPYMNDALRARDGAVYVASSLGLARMAPGGSVLTLLDPQGPLGRAVGGGVLALAEAPDGTLWLGSTQGLVHYDPRHGTVQAHRFDAADPHSLSDDLVVALQVRPDGTLWVGTQAGLNRLEAHGSGAARFRRYGVGDGLPDPSIDAIVTDDDGRLWVGTNRGVARLDPARDRFRAFGPGDGVPDSGVHWRAAALGADGSVYFGTHAGLLRLTPGQVSAAPPQPVMLGSYEAGGAERLHLGGPALPTLETPYDRARVRFVLAAFGDTRPLSYRMTGLESAWRDLPANLSVGYDPLPSGRYRFEVRQWQGEQRWSGPVLSIPVQVAPPPWRTRTAYAGYTVALLVLLGAGGTAGWRRRRLRQAHLRELHRLANYDVLTGLPNRSQFLERLGSVAREPQASFALLFIDLDRFKNINDSLGHRFGDRVLVAASQRLRDALPAGADLARLGGDEFTVIVPRLPHAREAARVAQQLIDAFARPLAVDGSEVVVTLSIGIGLFPADTREPTELVQYADSAMYHAKAAGRNAHRLFQPEMVAQVARRLALETGLRGALAQDELGLAFQPEFELASGRLCGAEVLLRWRSQEHGAVPPGEFIPILEDTGLIEPVGEWVLAQVCALLVEWRRAGVAVPALAVNVSVHQLIRGDLSEKLAERLHQLDLPGAALELEITESTLVENAQRMRALLHELRALGVGVAVDDFGTGYSSFASLGQLPVSKLKIDKIFIDELGRSERAETLCAAMVAMAHNLGLVAVAEGVESALQDEVLRRIGCDQAQGFFYGRPVPRSEFEAFVARRSAAAQVT